MDSKGKRVETRLGTPEAAGATGRVGCPGCKKFNGTLVGNRFACNTKGCKHQVKLPASPWTRGT